jgi:hypothetical protein
MLGACADGRAVTKLRRLVFENADFLSSACEDNGFRLVVGADLGSIPFQWIPTNTRYAPSEGCGKVLTAATHFSPAAAFRILPILSFGQKTHLDPQNPGRFSMVPADPGRVIDFSGELSPAAVCAGTHNLSMKP